MPIGGVLVWVVADGIDENHSESGTSFRQALGFMERGLRLHQTMIYQRQGTNFTPKRYVRDTEYMFVLSSGEPSVFNAIMDKPNVTAGQKGRVGRGYKSNGERTLGGNLRMTPSYGQRSNVWKYNAGHEQQGHPAIFPYQLAYDHIRTWTNAG